MFASAPLSSPRCPTCKYGPHNPRNLVVCIDGASNKPGPKRTYVKKLYDVVYDDPGHAQQKLYLEGIGAQARDHLPPSRRFAKTLYSGLETIFAWNVGENVKQAYKWLVQTYKEGDQIFLFGCSQGAYQVRGLASMIHEVGLLKRVHSDRIEGAYHCYLSIDPNIPESRVSAIEFKKDFCLSGVRIHFIGVWDAVSSLGIIKKDVHITASATVTNACHFRHALAYDERRVKFVPEYFSELSADRNKVRGRKAPVMDIKEVWFAGCHSDVGNLVNDGYNNLLHAGIVPLLWMSREASAQGLVLNSKGLAWRPDLGKNDAMVFWNLLEVVPICHQASFSDTGKHEWRWHLFRPRLLIPGQHVHFPVLPGEVHTPQAALTDGLDLPTVPQKTLMDLWTSEPWKSELLDEGAASTLLTSLLNDQHMTLEFLGEVLPLLSSRILNRQPIRDPNWSETSIRDFFGFDKLVLTVIYDVICNFCIPESLLQDARTALKDMFPTNYQLYPGFFHVIRFATRHEKLRQHFIADDDIIKSLVCALEQTAKNTEENLFSLVVDSLCYLIRDEGKRDYVVNQLTTIPDVPATADGATRMAPGSTRLSLALEVKAPSHFVASLNMIATLAEYPSFTQATDLCEQLRCRILTLEQKERGLVGSAAVNAFVGLNETGNIPPGIHVSNTIGYLGSTLPRLDVEVGSISPSESDTTSTSAPANPEGSMSSSDAIVSPHSMLQATGPILQKLGEGDMVVCKLLQTIESQDTRERAEATLTLLKLCRYPIIRGYCMGKKVVDIFMKQLQLKGKESSLLAAYALHVCLNYNMWTPDHFPRAAQAILTMTDKGWFGDAVGRVEGFKIFGELVKFDNLRQQVIDLGIVTVLEKKLESGGPREVRMSSVCLGILEERGAMVLTPVVSKCVTYLRDNDRKTQKKGVKILSALAQTTAGENAIKPLVADIVKTLLPSQDGSSLTRSQLYGPSAAVYSLCTVNETLRQQIVLSEEYATFRRLRYDKALHSAIQAMESQKGTEC